MAIKRFSEALEGQDIPELAMEVDRLTLVKYAGASDDYTYVHWDHPKMIELGFPDVVAHGWLTFAYMCRAVTEWAPAEIADIKSYAVRYRRPTYPGVVTCGGTVTGRRREGDAELIDLDLWSKDANGVVTTTAKMTLEEAR